MRKGLRYEQRRLNQPNRRPNPVCIPCRGVAAPATPATLDQHLPTARPRRYPSDTTDAEWRILAPHVPAGTGRGRPITYPRRDVVDAIRYLDRTGCHWDARYGCFSRGLPRCVDLRIARHVRGDAGGPAGLLRPYPPATRRRLPSRAHLPEPALRTRRRPERRGTETFGPKSSVPASRRRQPRTTSQPQVRCSPVI
jgi:Putative transposase of IS4/5 family (DUF4096)